MAAWTCLKTPPDQCAFFLAVRRGGYPRLEGGRTGWMEMIACNNPMIHFRTGWNSGRLTRISHCTTMHSPPATRSIRSPAARPPHTSRRFPGRLIPKRSPTFFRHTGSLRLTVREMKAWAFYGTFHKKWRSPASPFFILSSDRPFATSPGTSFSPGP